MAADWRIEPLQNYHDRTQFSCGEPALDSYLAERARKHQEYGVSCTFVAVKSDEPTGVLGYYSLAVGALDTKDWPTEGFQRFPKYLPLPIVRLARLAVDQSQQGNGIGANLVTDAMSRSLGVAKEAGVAALIVDAKHEKAKEFYLKLRYGFKALPDRPLTLWLLIRAIRRLFPA